jgi:hypothetical protein
LGTASPVVDSVDGHVETVAGIVRAPAPAAVAEILDAVDSDLTGAVAAVPVVDNVATPVVAGVVEPLAQPVLEPVVDQVVAPVLDTVVTPVIDVVTPPVSHSVSVLDPVLTPSTPAMNAGAGTIQPLVQEPPLSTEPVVTSSRFDSGALSTTASGTVFDGDEAADIPLLTSSHQPTAPVLPVGEPFTSAVLPGSSGSSAGGAGSGSGPSAATVLPVGIVPAPAMCFHSLLPSSDELPSAPSFDPGSTPG